MHRSENVDASQRAEADGGGTRAMKSLLTVLAVIGLVLVLTWAVSVFFEIAIVKSLAAVIIALFLIAVGLLVAGVA
jgi:hypothetical protein